MKRITIIAMAKKENFLFVMNFIYFPLSFLSNLIPIIPKIMHNREWFIEKMLTFCVDQVNVA